MPSLSPTHTNTQTLLQALKGAVNSDGQMGNWIGLVTLLCAVVMNESAVDSMQNGLVGNISSHLLRGYPLIVTRLCVVVINIPLIYLGTQRYSVLQVRCRGGGGQHAIHGAREARSTEPPGVASAHAVAVHAAGALGARHAGLGFATAADAPPVPRVLPCLSTAVPARQHAVLDGRHASADWPD
jgi:hypothetical protein